MKTRNKTIATIGFSSIIYLLGFFLPNSYLNRFEEIPPPQVLFESTPQEKETIPPFESFPVKLSIEDIGVSASIQAVGILNGEMAVPDSAEYVGWYKFGTHPGEIGSAVLAGHVNWKNGEDAVFTNLKETKIGVILSVTDNFGREEYFVVTDIKDYPLDSDASEVFFSNDNISRLNLITCFGEWNIERKTHDSRLVIFTEKI